MFLRGAAVVTSASDLTAASKCEYAFLRALDAKLGRVDPLEDKHDTMLERTASLGDEHEERVLDRYRAEFGAGVVEIERPDVRDDAQLDAALAATLAGFASGADIVFQATFFDGSFIGFADFIARQPDGRYQVRDTKLARSAKVTALLQLAAYAEQLERSGVPVSETVQLLLGDGTVSEHLLDDIRPVYALRRERLDRIVAERLADSNPVEWGDPRYTLCGRCDACAAEVEQRRDVLLVASLRVTQRTALIEAGIDTIDALAASEGPIEGMTASTVDTLRRQARLQLAGEVGEGPPPVEVHNPSALAAIPAPSPGDLFFDFEGDPLYTEGAAREWGLDYLFGTLDTAENFHPIWAHDLAAEREALLTFLAFVAERRAAHPDLHIYHYAAYERTHLLNIAARHGVGEAEVDQLLRENVLVDLYPIVRKAVRVGSRSYSIKKLEPLYMGDELRESEVTTAADSIDQYVLASTLAAAGKADESAQILDEIAEYNRYDCLSTLRLRDWLQGIAEAHGVPPAPRQEPSPDLYEPSPLAAGLLALAGDPLDADRDADRTALALAASAIDYHQRERKQFWWAHFARLVDPVESWEDTRDVLVVDGAEVERDWHREPGQQVERRWLRLRGRFGPGSAIGPGGVYLLYEYPGPFRNDGVAPGARTYHSGTVVEVADDGSLLVSENVKKGSAPWSVLPSALVPGPPILTASQEAAIAEWAEGLLGAQPGWPRDAVVDLLRRTPPRGAPLAPDRGDTVEAVVTSLLGLDRSYLAVQGPPGTGKTYLGSHVIARLVAEHRWKIGVVAQSHSVVENLLARVVDAGLDAALVGKVPKNGDETAKGFTALQKDGLADFAAERRASGFVIGGTAWDFSNHARAPRGSLDLLVIDEAGQYSLAVTIAASVAARNLLLLGDPQQLPQVSQGSHPEPVDRSALGWVSDGHEVLPPEFGYFLAESRRMHPAVAAPVSRLSYQGALRSHAVASERRLEGVDPGLHVMPIPHAGRSTASPEEADAVVALVRSALGRAWIDPSAGRNGSPLEQRDVIVVTPYNAQLALVREALDAVGLSEVPVGTVDKFQGQEAALAIVSLAASSAANVPRGMGFLIMKNRLNVAISRAKWAAFLVHSPALVDYLPRTPQGVAELSAFVRLVR